MKAVFKYVLKGFLIVIILALTIFMVRAFDARKMSELKPWHQKTLKAEFRECDYSPDFTFADYLEKEERLFKELDQDIYRGVESTDEMLFSRFSNLGQNNPLRFRRNWNRSYERIPTHIKGGALLLHGLTDSPYSLKAVGDILMNHGIYVLSLRMPGHGTIPGALTSVSWKDWMAAVKIGAKHVRSRTGDNNPFYIVGYSNGGALAVQYALEAVDDADLDTPDRLILFSPAIGLTRFASMASWHKLISFIPYFEKFKWESIEPEYDPFKYNSFPKNAGDQIYLLTKTLQRKIDSLKKADRLSALPPILTFLSLADATVVAAATVEKLYSKLENKGNELIVFDVNRAARLLPFVKPEHSAVLSYLEESSDLLYQLTLITNADNKSLEVVEKTKKPLSKDFETSPLGYTWPRQVYSLSHVAIPFSHDDPIYGPGKDEPASYGIPIGDIAPRGEKNLLRFSLDVFMRLRYNPFFGYVEKRLHILLSSE